MVIQIPYDVYGSDIVLFISCLRVCQVCPNLNNWVKTMARFLESCNGLICGTFDFSELIFSNYESLVLQYIIGFIFSFFFQVIFKNTSKVLMLLSLAACFRLSNIFFHFHIYTNSTFF